MIRTNYHTHTQFCDGSSPPEDYIREALKRDFVALGFSAHAPLPFDNAWSLAHADLVSYCNAIRSLRRKYAKRIEIYLSLEIDYIPGVSQDFSVLKRTHKLDYTVGAVHLVKNPAAAGYWFIDGPISNYDEGLKTIFHDDIRLGVETYFDQLNDMIATQAPDIIAHFDKIKMNNQHRFFRESDTWYQHLIRHTVEQIAKTNSIVEVNTRGVYTGKFDALYPGQDVLKQCYELNIPLTISADAHKPYQINAYFAETERILKDIGYKSIKVLKANSWEDWEL